MGDTLGAGGQMGQLICFIFCLVLLWGVDLSATYFVRHGETDWNVAKKILWSVRCRVK